MATLIVGTLQLKVISASNLSNADGFLTGVSDPYCFVTLDEKEVARTKTIDNNLNPIWNQEFRILLNGKFTELALCVFDEDTGKVDDLLGKTFINLKTLVAGKPEEVEVPLVACYGASKSTIKYSYTLHVANDWMIEGRFPIHQNNCHVTLYQSAHIDEHDLPPKIHETNPDHPFVPEACWEEIYRKLLYAKKFIYITGWSVNANISLLRRKPIYKGDELTRLPLDYTPVEIDFASEGHQRKEKKYDKKKDKKDKDDKDKDKKDKDDKDKKDKDKGDKKADKDKKGDKDKDKNDKDKKGDKDKDKKDKDKKDKDDKKGDKDKKDKDKKDKEEKDKDKKGDKKEIDKQKLYVLKERGKEGMLTVGELLKLKAREGVTVILHVWNEMCSVSMNGRELTKGMMETHDEETFLYFKDSGVDCRLSYREASDWGGDWIWSHHQKTIIVDDQPLIPNADPEKRRIIGFLGGIDLCDGRWDTPSKSLFRSLASEHLGDFHQVWPGITSDYGPRQPWQDIHSKVEGPIARDLLTNFEQRWRKQHADLAHRLLPIDNTVFLDPLTEELFRGPQSWTTQLLRSIDSTSSVEPGIEKTIQESYVNAIRMASQFIYIENQYFMGSSDCWTPPTPGCENRVPIEIVQKIEAKIGQNQRFMVYVVIPMFPEGIPTDSAIQEMLYWQSKTQVVLAAGLCFLDMSDTNRVVQSRRFQIYVHSKMMIVDDIFIIVGSANINERSMAGDRDSEIALGAYQPGYATYPANGRVHQFRMSLWAEHLGVSGSQFIDPNSPACKKEFQSIAKKNWDTFSADKKVKDMDSHIMCYPIQVSQDGVISANPAEFPDTTALILGKESFLMPNKLTM